MKLLRLFRNWFVCKVDGHIWRDSRSVIGFQTCRRCRSRRRDPLQAHAVN
jgi:hypothetical protein